MTKKEDKLRSIPIPSDYGKPTYWISYEAWVAMQFFNKIANILFGHVVIWGGKPITDKEKIYEIAKEVYKEYEDELPISYLEQYKP